LARRSSRLQGPDRPGRLDRPGGASGRRREERLETPVHLAQLNIGRFRHPLDDPRMADFVANLDRINAVAERSDGFIWRLKDDSGNATGIRPFSDPDLAVNLSVWRDAESLEHYFFNT